MFVLPENARMEPIVAGPPKPPLPDFELCTARALPMTGHRRAIVCRFDIAPPPGDAGQTVDVESDRSVAGEAFFKNGHTAFD